MATPTSPSVGKVMRDFILHLPFLSRLSLVGMPSLRCSTEKSLCIRASLAYASSQANGFL